MRLLVCFLLIAMLFCGTACADMENTVPALGDGEHPHPYP